MILAWLACSPQVLPPFRARRGTAGQVRRLSARPPRLTGSTTEAGAGGIVSHLDSYGAQYAEEGDGAATASERRKPTKIQYSFGKHSYTLRGFLARRVVPRATRSRTARYWRAYQRPNRHRTPRVASMGSRSSASRSGLRGGKEYRFARRYRFKIRAEAFQASLGENDPQCPANVVRCPPQRSRDGNDD